MGAVENDWKHNDLSEWDSWVQDSWINKGLANKHGVHGIVLEDC